MRKASVRREAGELRRATNISLDGGLIDEARLLGVNISRACQNGLADAVAGARAQRWLAENADAIQGSNDYVEKHGLPLALYRQS